MKLMQRIHKWFRTLLPEDKSWMKEFGLQNDVRRQTDDFDRPI